MSERACTPCTLLLCRSPRKKESSLRVNLRTRNRWIRDCCGIDLARDSRSCPQLQEQPHALSANLAVSNRRARHDDISHVLLFKASSFFIFYLSTFISLLKGRIMHSFPNLSSHRTKGQTVMMALQAACLT